MSWIHRPLEPDGTRPPRPPQVACDECSRTLLAADAHVVPALSAYTNAYAASHCCDGCRPAALQRVLDHLDRAGPREVATLVTVLEGHGVPLHEARARPLPKAREAVRRALNRLVAGELRLAIPIDPERHGPTPSPR